MPTKTLTDATVKHLKAAAGKRIDYFDASLPGFGLRVTGPSDRAPEGRRTWMIFYRVGGKQRRLSFEPPYPALSLGGARKQAHAALALVRQNVDPADEKARAKAPLPKGDRLDTIIEDYLAKGLTKKGRSPSYVTETRRSFNNHVLPRWGGREIKTITRREVIALLDHVAETGTTRQTAAGKEHAAGGPIAANRVLAAIRAMFNWSIRRGLIDINPCSLVERPGQEAPRERTLSAAELGELWPRFVALGYPFGPFFELTVITGQRRTEVAEMRWADVDLKAKTWSLGSGQTKAARAHVVPLSDMAIALLSALPRKTFTDSKGLLRPSPYIFTTEGDKPISGFSRAKQRIDRAIDAARAAAEADPMPAWGVHDLRRTTATGMGRLGTPEFIIGKVLNHAAAGVTGKVYNQYEYLAEKRQALEAWADYLNGLVASGDSNFVAMVA